MKSEHLSSRDSLRDRLRTECINRVRRERMNLITRLRTVEAQAPPESAGQKMELLQEFAKDLIANVQAEDTDAQMAMSIPGGKGQPASEEG